MGILFSSSQPHPFIDPTKLDVEHLTAQENSPTIIYRNKREQSSKHLRIVHISDTHMEHTKLRCPDGDILIHSGDFTNWRTSEYDVKLFNDWLGTLPHRYKIVICGNHETAFKGHQNPEKIKQLLTNCTHYLQDSCVEIEGIKIYGAPWHNERHLLYRANSFGADAQTIKKKWELIPNDVDLLVTHVPPFGVLDLGYKGNYMGCPQLLEACLLNVRPKAHLFGHNHDNPGCIKVKFNPNKIQSTRNNNTASTTQNNSNNNSSTAQNNPNNSPSTDNNQTNTETNQEENSRESTSEEQPPTEEEHEIVFMNGAQALSWKPLVLDYHY